jgi:hypothetical protein
MMDRRTFVLLGLALVACKTDAPRCAHCGMKIDPQSAFRAEIVDGSTTRAFDTPRCALSAWISGGKKGTVRVQDYYDRAWHDGKDLRFVVGSDVIGPMGPELVPVDAARVAKFKRDHEGTGDYAEDQLTPELLAQ